MIKLMGKANRHGNGATYEGDWYEDKQHGNGVETWLDGARYEGQYATGRKSGTGELFFADGSIYCGEFFNNDIHGKGEYKWPDGPVPDVSNGKKAQSDSHVLPYPKSARYEAV